MGAPVRACDCLSNKGTTKDTEMKTALTSSPPSIHPHRRASRTAAGLLAVLAIALIAPLALGGGSASALSWTTTVSGQVMVTAPCSQGGQPIINLGVGDTINGPIEIYFGSAGQSAVA